MNRTEFQTYIKSKMDLFSGVNPESNEELESYERLLGFSLPHSIKWLLSVHGYSSYCGIENLGESVQETLKCRSSIDLPKNILILNDWGDGGVVFCIANDAPNSEYEVIWSDAHHIHALCGGEPSPSGAEVFENFPAWVVDRAEAEIEESKY